MNQHWLDDVRTGRRIVSNVVSRDVTTVIQFEDNDEIEVTPDEAKQLVAVGRSAFDDILEGLS